MKVIGLTGGIGSGKSTVSAYLAAKGFPVIDADILAREIVMPGSPALDRLVLAFGGEILREDGSLNRPAVAKIIFADAEKKEALESIMHREITRLVGIWIEGQRESGRCEAVFVDAPLLFESKFGMADMMDEIWVVDAEDEIRIERVMKRDGSAREEIMARIRNQMSRGEKNKRAHVIIQNSGSEVDLYQQIDKLVKDYE